MLLIWGFKVVFKTLGEGDFHCPACRGDRHYRLRSARRWFTFFFIPIIPLKQIGEVVECTTCSRTFDRAVLDLPTASESATAVGYARRSLLAHMVEVGGNTSVSRWAAIAAMRDAGQPDYDEAQLDIDRATADWQHTLGWVRHLVGTLSTAGAESMLMAAANVGAADGRLTDQERGVLDDLGAVLGLTPLHVEGIVSAAHAASAHAHE